MKTKLLSLLLLLTSVISAQSDYCLKYDGVNSRVKYSTDATLDNLNGATDYTIEAWFYPTDTDINNRVILKRYYQFAITLYQNNNRRIYFTHYANNAADKIFVNSLNNVVNLNAWNHVAVINNSTDNTLKIYLNGVDVTADSNGNGTTQTALPLEANPGADANFYVAYGNPGTVFNGYVDKVRIKTTAEDPNNLNTSIDETYSLDTDTVLLMNFDEGIGTTTVNEVNGVDGELECRGGCNELPEWNAVQTNMAVNGLSQIDFNIYPNPVDTSDFFVETPDNQNIKEVQIMDFTGKVLFSQKITEDTNRIKISAENLLMNAYLMKVITNKGAGVQKLLVK